MRGNWSFLWIVVLLGAVVVSSLSLNVLKAERTTKFQADFIDEITVRVNLVFVGYNEEQIDLVQLNNNIYSSLLFEGLDFGWNQTTEEYPYQLDLRINLDWQFHFASQEYATALDNFVDNNSWFATTSALNTTALNYQEITGERMSIFSPQNGTAINGTAIEKYLANNNGFESEEPGYAIYFLNFSRFDTVDHSQEHWFEIDEIDPDSNETVSWFRLEWDNDLNPDVKYPYPAWGFRNRLYFIDPYCHQWYTKWTDIWWNPDSWEGRIDYRTTDLDSYLANLTPGTSFYRQALSTFLSGWLNDIVWDTAGRTDGYWANERSIGVQLLMLNDAASHGYTRKDLNWIVHDDIFLDAMEYIVPPEVANFTIETTWANISDFPILEEIITNHTLGAESLDQNPWYRPNWTYLDGSPIFYQFLEVREDYFDLSNADAIFTCWFILMQNVSMVWNSYDNVWNEFTALGGSGNTVFFKDLNRYFASDGVKPRSGATTVLTHEVGHVLELMHAEGWDDASQGAGGFMRDTMSYYVEGTPHFSVFLRDSLYRMSSIYARQLANKTVNLWRYGPNRNNPALDDFESIMAAGDSLFNSMDYFNAFLEYRKLYDLLQNECYWQGYPDSSSQMVQTANLPTFISVLSITGFIIALKCLKRRKRL
ncbi:MAG: hypothetical protein ACFFC7_08600 [Candidatus Hermodarchaeota archaeon]